MKKEDFFQILLILFLLLLPDFGLFPRKPCQPKRRRAAMRRNHAARLNPSGFLEAKPLRRFLHRLPHRIRKADHPDKPQAIPFQIIFLRVFRQHLHGNLLHFSAVFFRCNQLAIQNFNHRMQI